MKTNEKIDPDRVERYRKYLKKVYALSEQKYELGTERLNIFAKECEVNNKTIPSIIQRGHIERRGKCRIHFKFEVNDSLQTTNIIMQAILDCDEWHQDSKKRTNGKNGRTIFKRKGGLDQNPDQTSAF